MRPARPKPETPPPLPIPPLPVHQLTAPEPSTDSVSPAAAAAAHLSRSTSLRLPGAGSLASRTAHSGANNPRLAIRLPLESPVRVPPPPVHQHTAPEPSAHSVSSVAAAAARLPRSASLRLPGAGSLAASLHSNNPRVTIRPPPPRASPVRPPPQLRRTSGFLEAMEQLQEGESSCSTQLESMMQQLDAGTAWGAAAAPAPDARRTGGWAQLTERYAGSIAFLRDTCAPSSAASASSCKEGEGVRSGATSSSSSSASGRIGSGVCPRAEQV